MGTKYLVIGGIENEAPQWILKGTQGTLIEDSAKSDKTIDVEFSTHMCGKVKDFIDLTYNVAYSSIFGKT